MRIEVFLYPDERRKVSKLVKHIPLVNHWWKGQQAYLWTCVRNQKVQRVMWLKNHPYMFKDWKQFPDLLIDPNIPVQKLKCWWYGNRNTKCQQLILKYRKSIVGHGWGGSHFYFLLAWHGNPIDLRVPSWVYNLYIDILSKEYHEYLEEWYKAENQPEMVDV